LAIYPDSSVVVFGVIGPDMSSVRRVVFMTTVYFYGGQADITGWAVLRKAQTIPVRMLTSQAFALRPYR
jgi:hypothetical protein